MKKKLIDAFNGLDLQKSFLIGLAIMGLYYWKFYDNGANIERQINDARMEISAQTQLKTETDATLKLKSKYQGELGEIEKNMVTVNRQLPFDLKNQMIIDDLNKSSRDSSVKVLKVTPQDSVARTYYDEYPIRVDLEGDFSNIIWWMFKIAKLERITRIGDFVLDNAHGAWDGSQRISTTVISYKSKKIDSDGKAKVKK